MPFFIMPRARPSRLSSRMATFPLYFEFQGMAHGLAMA